MCGIVGLYLKNADLHRELGHLFVPMLTEMSERGPDSAGFAVYREGGGATKLTLYDASTVVDWDALARAMLRVIEDPEAGRGMGAAGYHKLTREFTLNKMVEAYEKLYRDLGRVVCEERT